MATMTMKVIKVNEPIFNASWEYARMHVWWKFGDSSYYADKVKFTDRQMDRQADNSNAPMAWEAKW